jgi:hypothetical protein
MGTGFRVGHYPARYQRNADGAVRCRGSRHHRRSVRSTPIV